MFDANLFRKGKNTNPLRPMKGIYHNQAMSKGIQTDGPSQVSAGIPVILLSKKHAHAAISRSAAYLGCMVRRLDDASTITSIVAPS
jgi:hypothetical protein